MRYSKEKLARVVREARESKGYTQQELSEIAGISLRSIQRIENADVLPRMYTVKVLAQHLDFSLETSITTEPESMPVEQAAHGSSAVNPYVLRRQNRVQKIILSSASAVILVLLLMAFLAQSARFPETDFEFLLLLTGAIGGYAAALLFIWR